MEESSYKETSPTTIQGSLSPPLLREPNGSGAKKPRRISSLFRKIGDEWTSFLGKIRENTHISYSDEEAIDSLFESSDDDFFERTRKVKRFGALTAAEIAFMNQHKKGSKSSDKRPNAIASTAATAGDVPIFKDLDMTGLRQHYLNSDNELTGDNVGQSLWEVRRSRWLTPVERAQDETKELPTGQTTDPGAQPDGAQSTEAGEHTQAGAHTERTGASRASHIPRELYPRIYNELIEKSTPLRKGKRIALSDLVNVMNAGWHSEKVWERASKGLP